ncbi:hypothetical protein LCGC14_1854440 [marine sediment metagenome]|uniref:Uncharacterized protein n=1 Tax=marine sediment metagenome TaxID=412755 RepID=A0A0F9INY3_9ZZZZ
MPISKFTTPIQAVPLTPKPRLPIKEIMSTLDRLTQSQEQGMIARSKFDLLRAQVNEQVLDREVARLGLAFLQEVGHLLGDVFSGIVDPLVLLGGVNHPP